MEKIEEGLKKLEDLQEEFIPSVDINLLEEDERFIFLRKMIPKFFPGASYFSIENLFIDIYSTKTSENCAFMTFNHTSLDISDENYFGKSKKSIEVFKEEYLDSARTLIKTYRKRYKHKIRLIDNT